MKHFDVGSQIDGHMHFGGYGELIGHAFILCVCVCVCMCVCVCVCVYVYACVCVSTQVLLILGIVFSLILYRIALAALFYVTASQLKGGPGIADFSVAITGAIIQLTCVIILNKVYEFLAYKLTNWGNVFFVVWCVFHFFFLTEMHRTQTQYDDSFTVKLYIFQFVNFYSSIFYIAFFKGK